MNAEDKDDRIPVVSRDDLVVTYLEEDEEPASPGWFGLFAILLITVSVSAALVVESSDRPVAPKAPAAQVAR